ncbi:uncharacterized protein LOC123675466 [Harmonia axyridis]|uniref:uncharacterized protein LOC123675466 n=1 Tax=Harmonia axyridis TaxID=115357 RepID=UPI001E278D72|nr:uncharacterized protein LOC123675466 [Harmonia axyridis]
MSNLSILCLTEHWKSKEQLISLPIKDFNLIGSFCRTEGSHGGSAVYLHKSIKGKTRKEIQKFSQCGDIECAAVEFHGKNTSVIVLTIYRPPNGDMKTFFFKLENILDKIHQENKLIIIAGDFNIEMLQMNKDRSEFMNLMESFNLNPTINEPTRITNTSSSSIDNIFTNILKWESLVFDLHLSDHQAQKLTIHLDSNKNNDISHRRFFGQKEKEEFLKKLFNQDWNPVKEIDENNVNQQWDTFVSMFGNIFNENFPKKPYVGKKHKNIYRTPKIDAIKARLDILSMLNKQGYLFTEEYRKTKKEYDDALAEERKRIYENRVNKSDNKSKTMWQICKEITGCVREVKDCQVEGTPEEVSDKFNEHFNNIVTTLMNNLPITTADFSHMETINKSFYLKPTISTEIENLGKSIKNKFSSGEDEIPIIIIKLALPAVSEILSVIVNNSFKYGIFPESLKLASIKPLFKNGKPEDINNYRPISLLPGFSRIFEMLMSLRLMNFFVENEIFTDSQHGYLRGRSTQTAIF